MNSKISFDLKDNGGRRSGIERRYFLYSNHIPERRFKSERRVRKDRRSGLDRRDFSENVSERSERRADSDRRSAWNELTL